MYKVVLCDDVLDQPQALPTEAVVSYFQALDVLELVPENGLLYNKKKPDGMRELLLGSTKQGEITYLLLPRQREVHIVALVWLDIAG